MTDYLEQALPCFNQLTERQKLQIQHYTLGHDYKKGDVILNPLKRYAGLKIIKSGQIKLSMVTRNGGELMLYRLDAGELCVLSVLSLLNQFEWDICVEAEQDSVILTIPEQVYLSIVEENPSVKEFHQNLLIQRLSEVVRVTSQAAVSTAEERLARFLSDYQRYNNSMEIHMTHQEMAKDIGTVREVVTRILKKFQEKGYVKLERGRVTILDLKQLESI